MRLYKIIENLKCKIVTNESVETPLFSHTKACIIMPYFSAEHMEVYRVECEANQWQ